MAELHCAVIPCSAPAITIARGWALCERCHEITDEIPDHVPATLIERIIADVIEDLVTLDMALARRGYTRPVITE